ncbi:MAG: helix-turn-helix domain-containing protein [Cyclobacteriaceae bacterium]
MKFSGNTKEYLQLETIDNTNCDILKEKVESSLSVLWFEFDNNIVNINGQEFVFKKNEIVFLTEFHTIKIVKTHRFRFLCFNRSFYCVLDHDDEVSCKGILFFGASQLPCIIIPEEEHKKFEILWEMFSIEMKSNDNLQIDMLQMMLKRYLILCTRLFKTQSHYPSTTKEVDLIREFNFLVEKHFKTKHTVAEYSELLNRSPKTISNLFSKLGSKTPLQFIQDRIMMEARQLLKHSGLQIQEVAYEIGYQDVQSFSRFFKKNQGVSPSEYKEKMETGKIDNSSGIIT